MEQKNTGISRRSFLTGTGATVGALAAGSLVGYNAEAQSTASAIGTGDFTWTDISVVTTMQNAFDGYFKGGCCYGSAYGIVKTLRDSGAAAGWTTLPLDMFKWGLGGGNSWGTLCGALNGTMAVMNLAGVRYEGPLCKWYERENFPLAEGDGYLTNAEITALIDYVKTTSAYKDASAALKCGDNKTYADELVAGDFGRSLAYSPLCHASVSRWCDVSGKTVGSMEKKFRCAMLTAATAGVAVKMKRGEITLPGGNNVADDQCSTCHTGGTTSTYDSAQGGMDCTGCHDTRVDDTVTGTVYNVAPECSR